jgi:hypothetical protein
MERRPGPSITREQDLPFAAEYSRHSIEARDPFFKSLHHHYRFPTSLLVRIRFRTTNGGASFAERCRFAAGKVSIPYIRVQERELGISRTYECCDCERYKSDETDELYRQSQTKTAGHLRRTLRTKRNHETAPPDARLFKCFPPLASRGA